MFSRIFVFAKIFIKAIPLIVEQISHAIKARIHSYTYKPVNSPRNIVVIGGSFGGLYLATRLANSVPTGYRVVLIEKKSHFNLTWLFPRVSVIEGHEHKALIPYGPGIAVVPPGSLLLHCGTAVNVVEKTVTLEDGTVFEYEYLAVATGSTGPPPWHLEGDEKRQGIESFLKMQREIREAKDLMIVGGGAVGVELASDAKSKYPEKNMTIIHSREKLLNAFGPKLHEYSMDRLNELGVNVHLGERVPDESEKQAPSFITLSSGKIASYDLLVDQMHRPETNVWSSCAALPIFDLELWKHSRQQLFTDSRPKISQHICTGDVAETKGVRMGRAAGIQAAVVAKNILRSTGGKTLKECRPISILEAGIDLTLGLRQGVLYFRDNEQEFLFPGKKTIALNAENAWKLNSAHPFDDEDYDLMFA